MRMPIQYALTWPERAPAPVPKIDWAQTRHWDFHAPDHAKFPLLNIAYEAQRAGGAATCIVNAADEIAVEAFLEEKIAFTAIAKVVAETLQRMPHCNPSSVSEIIDIDTNSRGVARDIVAKRAVSFGLAAVPVA